MAYFLVFCKQYLHRPALPTTRRMAMLWEKLRDVVLFPEAKLCTSPRIADAHSALLCLISRHPNLKLQLAMLQYASSRPVQSAGRMLGFLVSYLEKSFKSLQPSAPL